MPDPLILILALVMGGSILLIFAGLATQPRADAVKVRLEEYAQREVQSLEELELAQPFSERILAPLVAGIAGFFARFTPERTLESTDHRLDLADRPYGWGATEFFGFRALAALILGGLILALLTLAATEPLQVALFSGLAGLLGFFLPVIWLGQRIRRRQSEILRALPDALDLLTISVEAGLGFDAALAKVTEKWDNELSRAFARVLAEIQVGRLRREALRDMADKAEVAELTSFAAAIIQADQLGVSISRVLRIQSEQMRIRRRQRAEELAQQAPLKMVFPLVFLIFPALLVVILGPAIPQLRDAFVDGGLF
ncbi:MAG: type II secretion system F family protein [Anaerolineae bacterium]